jgi:3',5'-cyclic AMP phosphodiesterase CpdA
VSRPEPIGEDVEQVVAHLTDPHVFVPQALSASALLDKRLFGGINALLFRWRRYRRSVLSAAFAALAQIRPTHLVVTGDLSTVGACAELEAFRDLLSTLPLGPSDVTVVPGNHDAYLPSLVRARHLEKVLGPYMTSDAAFGGEVWPRVRCRGSLAIIACSTARPSAPLLALGTLGEGQLGRLEGLLGDARLGQRFRLLALHHPPQEGVGHWHNRLTDALALRGVLARQGAELVLHGHLHRDLWAELPGPRASIPVRGAASVSSTEPDGARQGGFWLHRLSGRHLVGSERWSYQAREGAFVPVRG